MTVVEAPFVLPGAVELLRFDATVPRQLVHRAAIAETFLTDAVQVSDDRFLVAAHLPRSHTLFNDVPHGDHDLLLLAEIVRQAGTLLSHRFYGVPEDFVFPLRRAQIEISDVEALTLARNAAGMVADIRLFDQQRQGGMLTSMTLRAELVVGDRHVGSAGGAMHFVSKSGYATLRGPHSSAHEGAALDAVPRVDPPRVGRGDARNVVVGDPRPAVGGAPYSCRILADTGHPGFFDHRQDHLPGMLLLEGYRQVALLAVADACAWAPDSLMTVACDASFSRYAEFDPEVRCAATVGDPVLPRHGAPWVPVSLEVSQQSSTLSTAVVRVADVQRP
jgi:hypothetical protein